MRFRTLKLSKLYNTQNHSRCKSPEFPQMNHVHSSVSDLLKKMKFKFPTMSNPAFFAHSPALLMYVAYG